MSNLTRTTIPVPRPTLITSADYWAALGLATDDVPTTARRGSAVSTASTSPTPSVIPSPHATSSPDARPQRQRRSIERIAWRWGIDNVAAAELALNFELQQSKPSRGVDGANITNADDSERSGTKTRSNDASTAPPGSPPSCHAQNPRRQRTAPAPATKRRESLRRRCLTLFGPPLPSSERPSTSGPCRDTGIAHDRTSW